MVSNAYICDKCNMFFSKDRKKVEEHEKIPVQGGGLNGLLLCIPNMEFYYLFTEKDTINIFHERIYQKHVIIGDVRDKDPIRYLESDYSTIGSMRKHKEIPEKKFGEAIQKIRKFFPGEYDNFEFKRTMNSK